jgi:hypothetical protein
MRVITLDYQLKTLLVIACVSVSLFILNQLITIYENKKINTDGSIRYRMC